MNKIIIKMNKIILILIFITTILTFITTILFISYFELDYPKECNFNYWAGICKYAPTKCDELKCMIDANNYMNSDNCYDSIFFVDRTEEYNYWCQDKGEKK